MRQNVRSQLHLEQTCLWEAGVEVGLTILAKLEDDGSVLAQFQKDLLTDNT